MKRFRKEAYMLVMAVVTVATALSCEKQPDAGEQPAVTHTTISEKSISEYLNERQDNINKSQELFRYGDYIDFPRTRDDISDGNPVGDAFRNFAAKVLGEYLATPLGDSPVMNDGAFGLRKTSLVTVRVTYPSVDGKGNPITLSGKIHFPVEEGWLGGRTCPEGGLVGILINCFPTMPQGVLTESLSALGASSSADNHAFKKLLVIEPDYIGFGESSNRIQTYLCQRLIARNCADMILPAIEAMKNAKGLLGNHYNMKFSDDNYEGAYIIGYSQGGGNALALARYLTVEDKTGLKDRIKLKHVLCADGPYDPMVTFSTWLSRGNMKLSVLLPMVLAGFKEGHSDVFDGTDISSFFTEKYRTYNNSGIIQGVLNRTVAGFISGIIFDSENSADGSRSIPASVKLSDILAEEIRTNPECANRKRLDQCLEAEQVHRNWKPDNYNITLFSLTEDDVVPVENTDVAYRSFLEAQSANVKCYKKEGSSHMTEMQSFFLDSYSYGWYKGEGLE